MSDLHMMITIGDRTRLPDFIDLYQNLGVAVNLIALGHGTASGAVLNYFGLESSEKAICFAVVTLDCWKTVKRGLRRQLRIDVPGVGVAFIVPLSSIGGRRELAFLTQGQEFEKGEESTLQGTNYELLVVISNLGFTELVMDAAREVGARGGTVIHARGTGMEGADKFLGISLAPEKDITFIVTRTVHKNEIMYAIMRRAGMDTKAKSIIFSLPVTDTAGLRLLDEEDEAETEAEAEAGTEKDG
ncbi:MAG: P-II family nitrogen regulator [Oscillospiraceae bacterium]|nr:P-II family nitrogen regulator [Oscillospiraceae bacterium]